MMDEIEVSLFSFMTAPPIGDQERFAFSLELFCGSPRNKSLSYWSLVMCYSGLWVVVYQVESKIEPHRRYRFKDTK